MSNARLTPEQIDRIELEHDVSQLSRREVDKLRALGAGAALVIEGAPLPSSHGWQHVDVYIPDHADAHDLPLFDLIELRFSDGSKVWFLSPLNNDPQQEARRLCSANGWVWDEDGAKVEVLT